MLSVCRFDGRRSNRLGGSPFFAALPEIHRPRRPRSRFRGWSGDSVRVTGWGRGSPVGRQSPARSVPSADSSDRGSVVGRDGRRPCASRNRSTPGSRFVRQLYGIAAIAWKPKSLPLRQFVRFPWRPRRGRHPPGLNRTARSRSWLPARLDGARHRARSGTAAASRRPRRSCSRHRANSRSPRSGSSDRRSCRETGSGDKIFDGIEAGYDHCRYPSGEQPRGSLGGQE